MPNIFLLVSSQVRDEVKAFMPELGPILRTATSSALGDVGPDGVAVMELPFLTGNNTTAMQIFAVASASSERAPKLQDWALALARAWRGFADKHPEITWSQDVDVWSIMPPGQWLMATDKAISYLTPLPDPNPFRHNM
jgi:hypothetical protein